MPARVLCRFTRCISPDASYPIYGPAHAISMSNAGRAKAKGTDVIAHTGIPRHLLFCWAAGPGPGVSTQGSELMRLVLCDDNRTRTCITCGSSSACIPPWKRWRWRARALASLRLWRSAAIPRQGARSRPRRTDEAPFLDFMYISAIYRVRFCRASDLKRLPALAPR